MSRQIQISATVFVLCVALVFVSYSKVQADSAPPGPFEQMGYAIFPAGYGELLNFYERSLIDNPDVALSQISEKLSAYTQALGRAVGVLDVAGKIYAGDNTGAAVSSSLMVLGELAGSASGKALLGAYGLTTLPVTTFITAVQIWQISETELSNATIGRQLESLYGSIESDPLLKNLNRTIGTGDPIPVNQDSVEHVWRKILFNDSWRNLFKVYVSQELGISDWPEPSRWERWTLPGNVIEEAALLENETAYKGYIAGLLGRLNTVAKKRESEYVIRKYGKELQDKLSGASPADILKAYAQAVKQLPKVHEFASLCPEFISRGLQERNSSLLTIVIDSSRNYATSVLNYLPTTGKIGAERNDLMVRLKQYHDQAWGAKKAVLTSLKREKELTASKIGVRAWRATRVGFEFSFDMLRSAVYAEFLRTGGIAQVATKIETERKNFRDSYNRQRENVDNEYIVAQQNPPVSDDRSDMAYQAFYKQLNLYESLDSQLYSELMESISYFLETLKSQKEGAQRVISQLDSQLNRMKNDLTSKVSSASQILKVLGIGSESSLPVVNYVGLLNVKFPALTEDINTLRPYTFITPYLSYLYSLERNVKASREVTSGSRKLSLPELIYYSEQLLFMTERFSEEEQSINLFRETLQEIKLKIDEQPEIVSSYVVEKVGGYKEFLDGFTDLSKQLSQLNATVPGSMQTYQTVLENIENDETYLKQLRQVLSSLSPLLEEFIQKYQTGTSAGSLYPGQFIFFKPNLGFEKGIIPRCGLLSGSATLMTEQEVKGISQDLKAQLKQHRLAWLEQKYNLKISEFALTYLKKQTHLDNGLFPAHYVFVELDNACRFVQSDYFDDLAAKINNVNADSFFPDNLHAILSGMAINNFQLLGLPQQKPMKIENLPSGHLDFIKDLIKRSWDKETGKSIQSVLDAFVSKHTEWQAGEKYFAEKYLHFEKISGQFRNLEYEAQAANNAMAENAELIKLFEKAVAMEPTITGFLSAVASDPKLSSSRQGYFSKLQPSYDDRFYHIREILRNLKQRAKNLDKVSQQGADEGKIQSFYTNFQQAYENKEESHLLSSLSDDWEAGDGTTLFDVEDYFHNMFNVFDEIQMQISGLAVQSLGDNRYLVNYETSITGRIFSDGLEHEEKSSVSEEVEVSPSGKVKIVRTPQGRFWYVK